MTILYLVQLDIYNGTGRFSRNNNKVHRIIKWEAITRTIANNLTTDLGGAGGINFRNIIINGDMSIAQRGTSTGQTSSGYICVDRFRHGISNQGTWTISQSTDVPTGQGFAKSIKMDCTTADASPAGADDYVWFEQRIEGFQNLQYLKKELLMQKVLLFLFGLMLHKTGTNILEFLIKIIQDIFAKHIQLIHANTWEKKTITFDGDTSGTFNNDNGESASFTFWLGAGSNYTSGTLDTILGFI
jgi:hypothetical protein